MVFSRLPFFLLTSFDALRDCWRTISWIFFQYSLPYRRWCVGDYIFWFLAVAMGSWGCRGLPAIVTRDKYCFGSLSMTSLRCLMRLGWRSFLSPRRRDNQQITGVYVLLIQGWTERTMIAARLAIFGTAGSIWNEMFCHKIIYLSFPLETLELRSMYPHNLCSYWSWNWEVEFTTLCCNSSPFSGLYIFHFVPKFFLQ
jgi:hypothetical protein